MPSDCSFSLSSRTKPRISDISRDQKNAEFDSRLPKRTGRSGANIEQKFYYEVKAERRYRKGKCLSLYFSTFTIRNLPVIFCNMKQVESLANGASGKRLLRPDFTEIWKQPRETGVM